VAFELGDLKARLLVNTQPFNDALARAGESARSGFAGIGQQLAGAFTIGTLVDYGRKAMEMADRLQDTATAAGTTATKIQALEVAAKAAGASADKMQMALSKIDIARAVVGSGSEEGVKLAAALERLGVSATMLSSADPAVIIEQIGKAMNASGDSAVTMNDVFSVFGTKMGPAFIQSLREIGEEGLDPLMKRLIETNRIMSEDTVNSLAAANKTLERFGDQLVVAAGKSIRGSQQFWEAVFLMARFGHSFGEAI